MIKMTVTEITGATAVTVLKLDGELDAAYYQDVIDKAGELYEAGTRDMLLDISGVTFLASSGLVALHSIIKQMRGEELAPSEADWGPFKDITSAGAGRQPKEAHFKLYKPQPEVQRSLNLSGFDSLLEIYTDWDQAIASFA